MRNSISTVFLGLCLIVSFSAQAQKKYQSLLWEITGNGVEKPSYLYGTMHVSDKVAFYLGDPFFEALESVDQVALELEPELWFDEVLGGDFMSGVLGQMGSRSYFGYYSDSWNSLEGSFKQEKNINLRIQNIFKQDPEMANQLLFRFYDPSGNFEEDTWLDMYIYQSAKKLGKSTLGLETFEESMEMMVKSNQESKDEESPARKLSNEERREIPMKIESAYRNADLDLLDSLSKISSPPSYLKYILIERNKNFVAGLDTLIRQKPIFAGMGAAHLPGDEGCIEMLRALGFTVKPVAPGKRDAKQKKKIENMVMKRSMKPYHSYDSVLSFSAPSKVYNFALLGGSSGLITMDIPNGSVTTVSRIMTYNVKGKNPEYYALSLDSILYETVPGEIMSKKKITNNGVSGFDILNQTRRGDYHRNHVYFLPDEIIIIRVTANGKKIKKGFADEFFSSIEINVPEKADDWEKHTIIKGSLSFSAPGRMLSYNLDESASKSGNLYIQKKDGDDLYLVEKVTIIDRGYLDFDRYELDRLALAMEADRDLKELSRQWTRFQSGPALRVSYKTEEGDKAYSLFVLKALGYYGFTAQTNDSLKAERFFNSVEIKNTEYSDYHTKTDSTLFYTTKIPWEEDESEADRLLSARYQYYSDDEVNFNRPFSRAKDINPPSTSDLLEVSYYRYSKYDFSPDKDAYPGKVRAVVADKEDLIIDTTRYEWRGDTLIHDLLASDTATNRRYHFRRILVNRSYYSITSTYDAHLGENKFAEVFRENFKPLEDSLSFPNLFAETDSMLLEDLMSTDTNTYKNAHSALTKAKRDYEDETQFALFKKLNENPPPLASEEEIEEFKTSMNSLLYVDNSATNIKKLKKLYRENADSAIYQQQILENLTAMKSRAGYNAVKELMIEEAPIGVEFNSYSGIFGDMRDTLELARTLYPEILELTVYDEYKELVISLLARMLDSGAINKNSYRSYVNYLVREAKAQFRRLSSNDGEEVTSLYSRKYDRHSYMMYSYWTLLRPYRNLEGPKKIFDLAKKSKKKHVIEAYASFRHSNGEKISDATCERIMDKEDLISNYYLMKRIGRTDFQSDTIDLVKEKIEDLINNNWRSYSYNDDEADTIVFVKTGEDSSRALSYHTYYYKYLSETYGKKKWYLSVVMVKKKKDMVPDFVVIYEKDTKDASKTEEEQFEFLRRKLLSEHRTNPGKTENSYNYNYYDEDYW